MKIKSENKLNVNVIFYCKPSNDLEYVDKPSTRFLNQGKIGYGIRTVYVAMYLVYCRHSEARTPNIETHIRYAGLRTTFQVKGNYLS